MLILVDVLGSCKLWTTDDLYLSKARDKVNSAKIKVLTMQIIELYLCNSNKNPELVIYQIDHFSRSRSSLHTLCQILTLSLLKLKDYNFSISLSKIRIWWLIQVMQTNTSKSIISQNISIEINKNIPYSEEDKTLMYLTHYSSEFPFTKTLVHFGYTKNTIFTIRC